MKIYARFFKRGIDFSIALVGLMFLSPFLLFIAVCLGMAQGGIKGIFFLHPRPGRQGKIFKIIKFKTMNDKRDAEGKLLPDAERLTPTGRLIRNLSLDELPQLINVLKGDMALIGPRPLIERYLALYTPEQARRHEVRPGITGWAQVNGRNDITWQKKFEMDVWYVDHLSFKLDVQILLMTVKTVLSRKGVAKEGYATTEPFSGNN